MTVLRKTLLWAGFVLLALSIAFAYGAFSEIAVPQAALLVALPYLTAGYFVHRGISRLSRQRACRLLRVLLPGVLLLYLLLSIWFMHVFRFTPVFDADALFTGAQAWQEGSLTAYGGPTYDAATYFLYFPNNLGATFLLRLFFACTPFLSAYQSACTACMIGVACAILFTCLCAWEMGGPRSGLRALWLLATTLPLWFSSGAFYTDFLSMAFPVGSFYFCLRGAKSRAWGAYAAAGAMAALGGMVKITVLILPVAVLLVLALGKRFRQFAALLCAVVLCFAASQGILRVSVYPKQLDPVQARRMNTPVLHWVMMGLYGDGHYNGWDYEFTRSFSDPAEARSAIGREIVRRIQERGPDGMVRHILRKTGYALCDGTLMLSDYYDDSPVGPQGLTELLLPGGSWYPAWKTACDGVHMAQLLLALGGVWVLAMRRRRSLTDALPIALFGLLCFLGMWEASRRYWVNFLPIVLLIAEQGFRRLPACGILKREQTGREAEV